MGYMQHQESDMLALLGMIVVIIVVIYFLKDKIFHILGDSPSSMPRVREDSPAEPGYHRASDEPSGNVIHTRSAPVKGIFVMVTSSEPQTQMVAMSLSNQTLSKGKYVRVLLCGPGGDLGHKSGKDVILKPLNKSPKMLLQNLIKSGVKVEVCPFYLANKGGTPADLIDGVTPASPPDVADGMLEPGVKLFTF